MATASHAHRRSDPADVRVRRAYGHGRDSLAAGTAVLQEAGLRVAVATSLGWAMAYVARHALEKMLYGVAAEDPRTFVGASVLVAAGGCAAALHPALRASRIDPMAALRSE